MTDVKPLHPEMRTVGLRPETRTAAPTERPKSRSQQPHFFRRRVVVQDAPPPDYRPPDSPFLRLDLPVSFPVRAQAPSSQAPVVSPGGPSSPALLDLVRNAIRTRHYSRRTEIAYIGWIRRFIHFHGRQHPKEMGTLEVVRYLTNLAVEGHVSASTQNQAFSALLFLYREVLERELTGLDEVVRAKRPVRVPLVLSREEIAAILRQLRGTAWLMASLIYGGGLRVLECARLRVKDIDLPAS